MVQSVGNAIIFVRVSLVVAGLLTASTVLAQPGTPCLPDRALATFGRIPFQSGSRIEASELSPDGKRAATFSYRSATIWDTRTGEPLHRLFFDIPASPRHDPGLAFSPGSKRFACRSAADCITVWDLADGKEVRRFQVEPDLYGFAFCRFSADGTSLIAQVSEDVAWVKRQNRRRGRALARHVDQAACAG